MSGLGSGLSSLGHSVKDKSSSFGHAVVDKSSSLGHTVKDKTSSFGFSVKDQAYRRHNHSIDDDLFDHTYHDLKEASKALKYLSAQMERFSKRYWPHVFKSMTRSTNGFLNLIGENSLEFENIDQYYDAFDKLQESSELFAMHPKERHSTISTISYTIANFLQTLEQLGDKVALDSDNLAKLLKSKNDEMRQQIKFSIKLLRLRTKRKVQYLDLHRKTEKLMKKSSPLEPKEEKELKSLERKTRTAKNVFENINTRLRLNIPEIIALLEEYIESITVFLISSQLDTFKHIEDEIRDFMEFHGYQEASLGDDAKLAETFEMIIDSWDQAVTPTRLRIEAFLTSVHDKHPEKIDEEITDKDNTSKFYKAWSSAAHKVTDKSHKLKPKDNINGIFGEDFTADPLRSFVKYNVPEINQSETYHPQKILQPEEVVVPESAHDIPPPLPPRDHYHSISLSPAVGASASPRPGLWTYTNGSNDGSDSESELSLHSDKSDDDESVLSSDALAADVGADRTVQNLKAVYNESKNDITRAPVLSTKWTNFNCDQSIFHETNTISFKLLELNKFFESALASSGSGQQWTARRNYDGSEPGDLSFKDGDIVQVICDLQNYTLSHLESDDNWIVAATNDKEYRRIGFAPATHFDKT